MMGSIVDSRYRILSKLGVGGMGVVYEAEDIKLGRRVAIKFLAQHAASDPKALRRFELEARAASALNHPHICTIYDVGEHAKKSFLVMELLSGASLKKWIVSEHETRIETAVELGAQIADALGAAHHAGIVHRDIKSSNIFVIDRGDAKVLDFGLAKMKSEVRERPAPDITRLSTSESLSRTGELLGTVAYMSPEQAAGCEIDERSDIFSLGVVLYEMAVGRRPFTGDSAVAIVTALHCREPKPLRSWNPAIPSRFEEIVCKALEKDRARRYQTAEELRLDLVELERELEWISTESTGGENAGASRKPENPSGRVQRKKTWSIALIAALLFALVIYLNDTFPTQDEIAADGVKELEVGLLGTAPETVATDAEAYALYLQARHIAKQGTADAFERSAALLQKAISIDPGYAPAWVLSATNYVNRASRGLLPIDEAYARARDAAARAVDHDPDHAPAHALLGWLAMYGDLDLVAAAHHLEHAIRLDPKGKRTTSIGATLLSNLGRFEEALAVEESLARRYPTDASIHFNLALAQRRAGRFDESIDSYRTVSSLSPERGGVRLHLGLALLLRGDASSALSEIQHETNPRDRQFGLAIAYHSVGRHAEADAALERFVHSAGAEWPVGVAMAHALRGEKDRAFEWLERGLRLRDPGIVEIGSSNLFSNLHPDPRWLPLVRRLGMAPRQLDLIEFRFTVPETPEFEPPED